MGAAALPSMLCHAVRDFSIRPQKSYAEVAGPKLEQISLRPALSIALSGLQGGWCDAYRCVYLVSSLVACHFDSAAEHGIHAVH